MNKSKNKSSNDFVKTASEFGFYNYLTNKKYVFLLLLFQKMDNMTVKRLLQGRLDADVDKLSL